MPIALYVTQLAATWFMTGLIWFVQVVHYPLFGDVGESSYRRYQTLHMKRTTWVVAPVMLVELATAVAAIWLRPASVPSSSVWIGLALLAAVWFSTAFVQVPAHGRLETGFDATTHRRLVAGNWIRTFAWTARAILLLAPLI